MARADQAPPTCDTARQLPGLCPFRRGTNRTHDGRRENRSQVPDLYESLLRPPRCSGKTAYPPLPTKCEPRNSADQALRLVVPQHRTARVLPSKRGVLARAVSAPPDSVSRFRRFRSALSSAADWQRASRPFSWALWMISSSSSGVSGLIRDIAPDVSPPPYTSCTAPHRTKTNRCGRRVPFPDLAPETCR
jgi:hypothetical protein